MKSRFKLIAGLCALLSVSASAETSLYEITKGDQKIYLGGTIHVLRSSDYPLPAEFEQAYENANILVLETDMKKASSLNLASRWRKLLCIATAKIYPRICSQNSGANCKSLPMIASCHSVK